MTDCLFCKIVAGDIPCTKIAENEYFLAFLDIAPINKGHALVIPKKHCRDISEFPEEIGREWFLFLKKIVEVVKKGVAADGINVGMNNGEAAGQVVFHQHTHIIPRFLDDKLTSWPNRQASPEELQSIARQILE